MGQYIEQKIKLEEIFASLNIKYEYQDLDDEDLNYFIIFDTPEGRLKALKSIGGVLYLSPEYNTLSMLILNVYKFKESDNIESFYRIINLVNTKLSYGNFSVYEEKDGESQIIYRCSIHCGNDFSVLDEQMVKSIIVNFVLGLDELFEHIFKEKNEKNE